MTHDDKSPLYRKARAVVQTFESDVDLPVDRWTRQTGGAIRVLRAELDEIDKALAILDRYHDRRPPLPEEPEPMSAYLETSHSRADLEAIIADRDRLRTRVFDASIAIHRLRTGLGHLVNGGDREHPVVLRAFDAAEAWTREVTPPPPAPSDPEAMTDPRGVAKWLENVRSQVGKDAPNDA